MSKVKELEHIADCVVEVLDELIEKGATWNQLEELLNWLLQQYGIGNEMESESEEGDDSPK